MLAAGKDTNLYLLDRDNMGKYNGNVGSTDAIYQELPAALSARCVPRRPISTAASTWPTSAER